MTDDDKKFVKTQECWLETLIIATSDTVARARLCRIIRDLDLQDRLATTAINDAIKENEALEDEIENAPWVYQRNGFFNTWINMGRNKKANPRLFACRAKLMRVEKLK